MPIIASGATVNATPPQMTVAAFCVCPPPMRFHHDNYGHVVRDIAHSAHSSYSDRIPVCTVRRTVHENSAESRTVQHSRRTVRTIEIKSHTGIQAHCTVCTIKSKSCTVQRKRCTVCEIKRESHTVICVRIPVCAFMPNPTYRAVEESQRRNCMRGMERRLLSAAGKTPILIVGIMDCLQRHLQRKSNG